jgi:transcriptional regulator with XRE-family HTH domain
MHGRIELNWKLRRIAAGLRQQDLAALLGMSASRYSAIERGDVEPTEADRRDVERALPELPAELGTGRGTENNQLMHIVPAQS